MTLFPKVKKQRNNTDDTSAVDAAGIDLLGDLAPLAKLVRPIHERAAEHAKYLDALGKARFQLRPQENAPPPDMKLAIQRETVAATGDAAALARFDAENAEGASHAGFPAPGRLVPWMRDVIARSAPAPSPLVNLAAACVYAAGAAGDFPQAKAIVALQSGRLAA